jgi:hypothetical protein
MNGLITRALAVACAGTCLAAAGGCKLYRNLVDPCYPERYAYEARESVVGAFGAQVNNGHVLDQTVWAWHFEKGSDRLTLAGQEHLSYLARRRPQPDPKVYLQTATALDVSYDPAAPDKLVNARAELDARRVQSIQKYLGAATAARPVAFDVQIHDPGDVGFHAAPVRAYMGELHKNIGAFDYSMPPFSGSTLTGMGGSMGGSTGGSR